MLLVIGVIIVLLAILWVFVEKSPSLYDRLGGIYSIAAVVNHFSDNLIKNPIVGIKSANPQLRKWNTESLGRLPGLKFMRTLWVAAIAGGPYTYVGKDMASAHANLKITQTEFNAVVAELTRSLDYFKVPLREKSEVLAAFASFSPAVIA